MGKLRKVYLPPWTAWFGLAMIVPMWGWITYQAFFTPDGGDMGFGGWLLATLVLGVTAVVMVLMATRKLPAYLVETGEDDEAGRADGTDP